jgi:hypothetical protein
VHGGNVKESNIMVKARLSIDVASLANRLSTIVTNPSVKRISGELGTEISVDEGSLRVAIIPEDDTRSVFLGCVVDG